MDYVQKIPCFFPDILGFRWAKSHEKRPSYGRFSVFCIFEHFPSIFQGFCFLLTLSKNDSLLNSGHFDLWMGKIGWKMSELWPFFSFLHFWALSVDFSGFLLSAYSFLKDSLLHSEHFGPLLGKIAWKLRELWPFLVLSTLEQFWALSVDFLGFLLSYILFPKWFPAQFRTFWPLDG